MADNFFTGVSVADLEILTAGGVAIPNTNEFLIDGAGGTLASNPGMTITFPSGTTSVFNVVDNDGDDNMSGDTTQEQSDDTNQQTIDGVNVFYDFTFELSDGTNTYIVHVVEVAVTSGPADHNGDVDSWLFFEGSVPPEGVALELIAITTNSPNQLDYDTAIPCFVDGTKIDTKDGMIEVESLSVGTELPTSDGSFAKIVWIGQRSISMIDMLQNDKLLPVRIRAHALGQGYPAQDLLVSQQHRILVRSKIAKRMYGQTEVLVPAKLLSEFVDGVDVITMPRSFSYWHFACEKHEIVLANGAHAETLYLGTQATQTLNSEQMEEIRLIFPDLMSDTPEPVAARPLAKGKKAKSLLARHSKNRVHGFAEVENE